MITALVLLTSLPAIECPRWLPGTDQVLPPQVHLTPDQQLSNNLRCYCEIVKPAERECIRMKSPDQCKQRTLDWINRNLRLNTFGNVPGVPRRLRMISVEP